MAFTDISSEGASFRPRNLDPSAVVALGTPALVEAKSRELIAVFGDTGRFILNAGCAIPATAPEANIRAMVHAARMW